jgi:hypothetical protein
VSRRASRATFAVAAVVLALSRASLAQPSDEEAARSLFKEGLGLHEARDFAGALEKFRAAYARWKNPKILTNIGTAAWELGRYVEAAEAYDGYLADAPQEAPNRAEVEKALAEVVPKVGTFALEGASEGRVTLDGRPVDSKLADRIRVDPGSHTLVRIGDDGKRVERRVEVAAGATAYVSFGESPPGVPQPPAAEEARGSASPRVGPAVPWVVGGIGVAGLAASGAFFLMHRSAVSDLDARCIDGFCPDSESGTIDRANTFGTVSAVALGVGVVGVGASIVLFSRRAAAEPASGARLGLSVSALPGAARATARLRF